jgi:Flp pilus assembly pilin Flp
MGVDRRAIPNYRASGEGKVRWDGRISAVMMHWGPRRRLQRAHPGRPYGEEGQSNVEYALIVAGVAIILLAAVWAFGGSTDDRFTTTATDVPSANLKPPDPTVRCDSNYTGCIPPAPPKLSCEELRTRGLLPVSVIGSDPHGLDNNGDGVACNE